MRQVAVIPRAAREEAQLAQVRRRAQLVDLRIPVEVVPRDDHQIVGRGVGVILERVRVRARVRVRVRVRVKVRVRVRVSSVLGGCGSVLYG